MAHLYASGGNRAQGRRMERIVIGGQEQVDISKVARAPRLLHLRTHTQAPGDRRPRQCPLPGERTAYVLCRKDYTHGVDLVSIDDNGIEVEQLVYTPQHRLRIIEADSKDLTLKRIETHRPRT